MYTLGSFFCPKLCAELFESVYSADGFCNINEAVLKNLNFLKILFKVQYKMLMVETSTHLSTNFIIDLHAL